MTRRLFLFVLYAALWLVAPQYSCAQLLWKVDAPSAEKPSYIFGTMHLADESFLLKVPGFYTAFAGTDICFTELTADEASSLGSDPAKLNSLMLLPDSCSLSGLLGTRHAAVLDSILIAEKGLRLSDCDRTCPLIIFTLLQSEKISKHYKTNPSFQPIDIAIARNAAIVGKECVGLETADTQIAMLAGIPLDTQAEMLRDFLDNYNADSLFALFDAYFAGDIETVARESFSGDPHTDDMLINSRNRRWADILAPIMRDKPVFVAVGAAHLGSYFGLLELLRKKGFNVSPAYPRKP